MDGAGVGGSGGHNVVAMRLEVEGEREGVRRGASYVIEWLSLKFCQF